VATRSEHGDKDNAHGQGTAPLQEQVLDSQGAMDEETQEATKNDMAKSV
jgi:hypothetical protein